MPNRVTASPSDDLWTQRDRQGAVHVLFTGRGYAGERADVLHQAAAAARSMRSPAWLRQVHAADVVEGRAGPQACGEGDALVTTELELPLSIATADCVPVLFADSERIAAAHAGWRGLARGVLAATLARLEPAATVAWIGPAIGPCCYEVSEEVATEIDASTTADVIHRPMTGERPHVDLVTTAERQLADGGVTDIRRIEACTRCAASSLWSYRREGPRAGRNLAFIWRA